MKRVVKKFSPANRIDLNEAIAQIGEALYSDEWLANRFEKKLPFYLSKEDFGSGKELVRARYTLKRSGKKHSTEPDYFDLPISDIPKAKSARDMYFESYRQLIGSAEADAHAGIEIHDVSSDRIFAFSDIPVSRWTRKAFIIQGTGHIPLDVEGEFGRVLIKKDWLKALVSAIDGRKQVQNKKTAVDQLASRYTPLRRGNSGGKRRVALDALKEIYPKGIPQISRKIILEAVNEKLSTKGHDKVSIDTLTRALAEYEV